jgi:hypothetical protein
LSPSAPDEQFPELLILTYSCPLKWDDLTGTHAVRHCGECSLNVLNISHSSESEVDEAFARARAGEKVCIRSEGQGPKKSGVSRSFKLGMATAMSIASAWLIGFLKTPAAGQVSTQSGKKKTAQRNVFKLEEESAGRVAGMSLPRSIRAVSGDAGSVAQLGVVDVYCNPTMLPQQSNAVWNQIHQLKYATNCERKRSDPHKKLREQIIKRAENDKVVVTDEVIELSNKYRKSGLDAAADQTLGLAVTLLDLRKSTVFRRSPMSARAGESPDRTISRTFGYSMTKTTDLQTYNRLLEMSDQQLLAKDYSSSAVCLKEALVFSLSNPLLSPAVRKTDFAKRLEQVQPFLPKAEFTNLQSIHEMVKTRLDDLSKLKS